MLAQNFNEFVEIMTEAEKKGIEHGSGAGIDRKTSANEAKAKPEHDRRGMAADQKRVYGIYILYVCKGNAGSNERTGAACLERITESIKKGGGAAVPAGKV